MTAFESEPNESLMKIQNTIALVTGANRGSQALAFTSERVELSRKSQADRSFVVVSRARALHRVGVHDLTSSDRIISRNWRTTSSRPELDAESRPEGELAAGSLAGTTGAAGSSRGAGMEPHVAADVIATVPESNQTERVTHGGQTRPTGTVVVIDDDVSVRESVEGLIRAAGWLPETFASAEEFLCRPRRRVPCCLVVDVMLPGLSGLEL